MSSCQSPWSCFNLDVRFSVPLNVLTASDCNKTLIKAFSFSIFMYVWSACVCPSLHGCRCVCVNYWVQFMLPMCTWEKGRTWWRDTGILQGTRLWREPSLCSTVIHCDSSMSARWGCEPSWPCWSVTGSHACWGFSGAAPLFCPEAAVQQPSSWLLALSLFNGVSVLMAWLCPTHMAHSI